MVEEVVLEYLRKTNRPYSANEIQNNLKDYGKTAIVKVLDSLVGQDKIIEKAYGKQKIYYINQDAFDEVKESEVKEIEEKIKSLHAECENLQIDFNKREAERNRRKGLLTMKEIESTLASLEEEINMLKDKIAESSQATVQPDEFKKVKDEHTKISKEVKKRKRVTREAIDLLMENYQGKKADLLEELDIEL